MIDTRVITLSHDEVCKAIRDYCNRNGKSVPHSVKVNIVMTGGIGATVETPYIEPASETRVSAVSPGPDLDVKDLLE